LPRTVAFERNTRETQISGSLTLEGTGKYQVETPIGFFTHMLETFAKHGCFDLTLTARGDVHVDQHHLVEDVGLWLGKAFDSALGERRGIFRAGHFSFPMDETLSEVSVDLSGRPFAVVNLPCQRRQVGELDADLLPEFFKAFADQAKATVHLNLRYGGNDHHRVEAAFKAWARAMRQACTLDPARPDEITSVKGSLR
jgi:imidazoleglycerol-phosphate dehydratase